MPDRRLLAPAAALATALALPHAAAAHAGRNAPAATNFTVRIAGISPATRAVEAKAVDGDLQLWLRARRGATVVVPGVTGEPLLRFDPRGVFVNLRSLTAVSDRIDPFQLRPDPRPGASPAWHRLAAGPAYRWHEHRLHALEPLARGRSSAGVVGRWTVPLLVDGRRETLAGTLDYHPPGPLWPWLLVVFAAAAVPVAALPSPRRVRPVAALAALAATLLIWALRVGRELYGRPSVPATGLVAVAATSLLGAALLYGLLHRDEGIRFFTAFLVAFGCLYQGLTMLAVLTHGLALTALPTTLARPAVAAVLGLGAGLLVTTMREMLRDDPRQVAGGRRRDEPSPIPAGAGAPIATPPATELRKTR